MVELNQNNLEETLKTDKLVVIDFWAEWCGPCRMIDPIIKELAEDYSEKIVFAKCNVDDEPLVTAKFSVRNIPTVLFIKNKSTVDRQVGAVVKKIFVNKINLYI